MANSVYKPSKIISGVVKSNMQFWGGSKVPALNGLVNFMLDPAGAMEKFKGPLSDKQKLIRAFKEADESKAKLAEVEGKISSLKNSYESLLRNMLARIVTIMSYDAMAFKNQQVKYAVTTNLLKSLSISSLPEMKFLDISRTATVPNQEKTAYFNLLNKLKTIETNIMAEMNKANVHINKLRTANYYLSNTIRTYQSGQ